ncbi:MAG: ribonuclease HII [Firmicutes bacterium]|nr:ribonuclease HII [Bacillota bacterium]
MTKEERLQKQREKMADMRVREDELRAEGYKYIAGVDEVGRGPLAGPVIAAAVVLPEDFDVLGIDDSKKLSEKKRNELFEIITQKAVAIGVGGVDEKTIDEISILQATKLAMKRAVEACEIKLREKLGSGETDSDPEGHVIDYILFDAMKIEDIDIQQESIVKGDAKVLAIAAASIIAKVTRDLMMVAYDNEYPGYAFAKNKGYGTKEHYEGLHAQGMCPIHRRTFLKNLEL